MVTGGGRCEKTVSSALVPPGEESSSEDTAERTSPGKLLPAGGSVRRLASMGGLAPACGVVCGRELEELLREEVVTAVAGRAFWGRSLIPLHGLLDQQDARQAALYKRGVPSRFYDYTPWLDGMCELGDIVISTSGGCQREKKTAGRLCKLQRQKSTPRSACLHCLAD